MKKLLSLALLISSFSANAAFLDGQTLQFQTYFPDLSTPVNNAVNGSGTYLVGNGVEYNGTRESIDFSDNNVLIDFFITGVFTNSTFNGFVISDINNTIADITSVSLNAATNMVGLDLTRITFNANSISVNWGGLSFNPNTIVSLDIQGATTTVPEPTVLALLGLGFAGMRLARRKAI